MLSEACIVSPHCCGLAQLSHHEHPGPKRIAGHATLLKQIVNNEPDLADGLLCSLGAKYYQIREARGDE